MFSFRLYAAVSFLLLSLPFCIGIRSFPDDVTRFPESPDCAASLVHIAMTLDSEYLRGSIAAVQSVIKHASCPESVFLHLIAAEFDPLSPRVLTSLVRSTFPSLNFKVYIFREDAVINLISTSIRVALDNPLNYARNYLGDILGRCVGRVIYLDSDVLVVDDIHKLWNISLTGTRVIGAPEYCHANFTNYFTDAFWADPILPRVFSTRKPCYFNTGVMVMDLDKWRNGGFRRKIESWMELQKKRRIYELGSLPPFLLVFAGNVEGIDHRWNQNGLGGDNVRGSCRGLHPGKVSLLHWSGKGKPWVRLEANEACPIDHVWEPYDFYKPGRSSFPKYHQFSDSTFIEFSTCLLRSVLVILVAVVCYKFFLFFVSTMMIHLFSDSLFFDRGLCIDCVILIKFWGFRTVFV